MPKLTRYAQNPILTPSKENNWEAVASFNGSITKHNDTYVLLYRALSKKSPHHGEDLALSVVGMATSSDGKQFENKHVLLEPEKPWDMFGCEDPRVTKIDDTYYIFYTALSDYPFTANTIKIAVATTKPCNFR